MKTVRVTMGELKQLIKEAAERPSQEITREGLAIFKAALGKNALGSFKAAFHDSRVVDGRAELVFSVNTMEWLYSSRMRSGNVAADTSAEHEAIMQKLVKRIEAKVTHGWRVVYKGERARDGYLVLLVKDAA